MSDRQFHGDPDRLRDPARLARLEVDRVIDLCLDGIAVEAVLDVGTGTGIVAEGFDRRGLRVTGIDVNPHMVTIAQQHVPGGQFIEAAADSLPFEDGAFDLVFLGHVLHEVNDPARVLGEARRAARARVAVLEWPYLDENLGPPIEHRLRDEAIAELGIHAGFQKVERLPLAHMVLYRLTTR